MRSNTKVIMLAALVLGGVGGVWLTGVHPEALLKVMGAIVGALMGVALFFLCKEFWELARSNPSPIWLCNMCGGFFDEKGKRQLSDGGTFKFMKVKPCPQCESKHTKPSAL